MAKCLGCNTRKAWWVRSSTTNNGKGKTVYWCSECSTDSVPRVATPEHRQRRPSRQASSAAFRRTPRERDQIVNHMVKHGSGKVDQFAVMSNDGTGNVVREEFNSRGAVLEKKVLGKVKI